MYKFRLPIGDWSDDGHGKCTYYIVESNKPVTEVRETHFKVKEITGIDIHKICNQYEESSLCDEDVIDKFIDLGFEFQDYCDADEYDENNKPMRIWLSDDSMVHLWVFLLKKTDKELELEIIFDDIPMLPFYGFDEKGRNINFVGYGCF